MMPSRLKAIQNMRRLKLTRRFGHCAVTGCNGPLDAMGSDCGTHGKRSRQYGSATLPRLDSRMRRRYILLAKDLIPDEVVHELDTLLSSLPVVDQRNVRGLSAKERAMAILANIHKQRGSKAALLILAAAVGAECAPKETSNPRYAQVQVGRCVFRLLRSDFHILYGRRMKARISMQGFRTALELWKLVESAYYFWLKDGGRAAIARKVAPILTLYESASY
jgi:hypothetical protein